MRDCVAGDDISDDCTAGCVVTGAELMRDCVAGDDISDGCTTDCVVTGAEPSVDIGAES